MKIKVDKNLIATYLSLDSKKADEYLANLANQIKAEITASSDNDEVFEYLNLLGEFIYKVPKEVIEVARYVIEEKPKPATLHKSPFGEFKGKSHKDLVLRSIELLEHIRYIVPEEILKILSKLSLDEDLGVKNKVLEVIKKLSQYNYNVLTKSKIGYGVQRKVLDFVFAWTRGEQLKHIDFVEAVLREILGSSVEGTTSGLNKDADYTLTIHFGVVDPTKFLKEMRREAINLNYELYKATEDPKLKLKLVNVFDEVSQTPSNVQYGDNVTQMIVDDLKYVSNIYRRIIFGEKEEKVENLGIASIIEERLYWINKSEKKRVEELEGLRKDILQDELYKIFRLLVGDPVTYREEEGWDTAEKKYSEEINKLLKVINESNIEEWITKLNKIAVQRDFVEEWKFQSFKNFLRKLAELKPECADKILEEIFKKNGSAKYFAGSFLEGFRQNIHFDFWDKYVLKIATEKNTQLLNAVIYSLNLPQGTDLEKNIRNQDIDLLEEISTEENRFSFVREADASLGRIFHYALFNTLGRNYNRAPERIEPLMAQEFKIYKEYSLMFSEQIPTMLHWRWFKLEDLQSETIELIKEKMIDLPNLDWEGQETMLAIGQRDGLKAVLDLFLARIKRDLARKRMAEEYYQPIPYHFNPDLQQFISQHQQYNELIVDWIAGMTTTWSAYNLDIGLFLQRIGKGFNEIVRSLTEKGAKESLMKAARIMYSIDGVDIDLSIEIIRRTDDQKIINQIDSNLYATGIVSGEYGLAEAFEKKAGALEKYKNDENERVKNFAQRMIKNFLDSAKRERQQTDEEKQLRKIEFQE